MRARRALLAPTILAVALLGSGCGSDDDDDDGDGAATEEDAAGIDTTVGEDGGEGDGGGSDDEIDACSLLTDDEAAEALGDAVVGSGPGSGVGESVCTWESAGDWSVTVSVGSPGTAPGDEFDPAMVMGLGEEEPVAGLEGAYHVGLGTVAFAADERLNTVQVVTPTAGGGDEDAAAALAVVLQERIEDAAG